MSAISMTDRLRDYEALVKTQVRGQWPTVLYTLCPPLRPGLDRPGKMVGCPLHQGKTNKNFRFMRSYVDNGACVCNTCGDFDGFGILMRVNGWGWVDCVNAVGDLLGIEHPLKNRRGAIPPPAPVTPKVIAKEDPEAVARKDAKARADLNQVWMETVPVPQLAAVACYLQNRGLPALPAGCHDLRAHPGLEYWHTNDDDQRELVGKFPTLIAMFRAPDGRPVTLHRVYVATDGSDKAPVPGTAKKSMSVPSDRTMTGGAVRIDPNPRRVLVIAEGLETALAVRAMTGLPTWAVLTANLLESVAVPEQVEVVIIFTDRDRSGAGQRYAAEAVQRVNASGRSAISYEPPFAIPDGAKGVDWADVLEVYGWRACQTQPFVQDLLKSLGKELTARGRTWRDAYSDL